MKDGRPALRDAAFAAIALIVVLAIPLVHRSPAFEDFVIRLSAMALFATSLNLLVATPAWSRSATACSTVSALTPLP